MGEKLTWGLDGHGRRHYICRHCGEPFGTGDKNNCLFSAEIEHECEDYMDQDFSDCPKCKTNEHVAFVNKEYTTHVTCKKCNRVVQSTRNLEFCMARNNWNKQIPQMRGCSDFYYYHGDLLTRDMIDELKKNDTI